ncbi:hypothetical protein B0H13DRAFT_2391004 [Mycena leptocephala]|nr:hypothetical protein B0H13DRAFT_2391004 [Mycena leptocephala]
MSLPPCLPFPRHLPAPTAAKFMKVPPPWLPVFSSFSLPPLSLLCLTVRVHVMVRDMACDCLSAHIWPRRLARMIISSTISPAPLPFCVSSSIVPPDPDPHYDLLLILPSFPWRSAIPRLGEVHGDDDDMEV